LISLIGRTQLQKGEKSKMTTTKRSTTNKDRAGRRRFLKGSASAVAALAAAPTIITSRRGAADDNVVRILGVETVAIADWSDFEKDTGLKMEFTGIDSDPGLFMQEIVANEAGSDYDIFAFDGGLEDTLGPEGYFLPIDEDAMSRWASVADGVKRGPLSQGPDGVQYGVPLVFNADSVTYYPADISDEEPLSWGVLFESEETRGRVALEDTWLVTLPVAGSYLKYHGRAEIDDPANMTPEEAKTTVDYLIERKQAGQFRALWGTIEEVQDLLATREVIAASTWEPPYKELRRQGKDVRYAEMIECYVKWILNAYVPRQVEERNKLPQVYTAMDWLLGGNYGVQIALLRGYATGNPDLAIEYANINNLPTQQIAEVEANKSKVDRKFSKELFWQNSGPENVRAIEAEWERFKRT
jgi:spermidine/putrescine-binding protein